MRDNFEDIQYKKENGVATITLNRPKVLNAFREQTTLELIEAFDDANFDSEVGVIILNSTGKHFCTGGDVKWQDGFNSEIGRKHGRQQMRLSQSMRDNGKPVIASIRGYCVGGGNELNLLSDLTVASENAVFGQAGPRMGSVPVWYGVQMLPRLVGEKKAREIVYLTREYSAHQAMEMGWINTVVPDERLEAETLRWAEELLDKSPASLRIAKTVMNTESDLLYNSVASGYLMLSMTHSSEEFHEGTSAFIEKRKPNFRKYRGNGQ